MPNHLIIHDDGLIDKIDQNPREYMEAYLQIKDTNIIKYTLSQMGFIIVDLDNLTIQIDPVNVSRNALHSLFKLLASVLSELMFKVNDNTDHTHFKGAGSFLISQIEDFCITKPIDIKYESIDIEPDPREIDHIHQWTTTGRHFNNSMMMLVHRNPCNKTTSVISKRNDNILRVSWQGVDVRLFRGLKYNPQHKPLAEQPDRLYAYRVMHDFSRSIETRAPLVQHVSALVLTKPFQYRRVILPCYDGNKFTDAISICKPLMRPE